MKNYSIEIKWALIYVIISFFWIFIQKYLGFFDENISIHLFFSVLIVFILIPLFLIAQSDKKKNFLNGKMTWRQAFISGSIIIVIATLFVPLLQYLTYEVINPDFFEKTRAFYTQNGKMTAADATARFNLKSSIIQSISDSLSFGIIFSALTAFFTKSK